MPTMVGTTDLAWILPAAFVIVGVVFAAGRWYASVNADRADFKEFMKEVRQDIKEILNRMPPIPVAGDSPLRLTEFGEKMSEWMKATEWAKREAAKVRLMGDEEPFNIDSIAERYVRESIDGETDILMAKCAYEFGTDKEGVRSVLRVMLRDELLKRTGQGVPD